MTGHLSAASRMLDDMIDGALALQAEMLWRTAAMMRTADADEQARDAVEGAREWRRTEAKRETRHASTRA